MDEIYEATKNEPHKSVTELIREIKLGVENEAYQQGRADAIKEVCEFMMEYGIIDCHFCPCNTCDDDCWVTLAKTMEQLKEKICKDK